MMVDFHPMSEASASQAAIAALNCSLKQDESSWPEPDRRLLSPGLSAPPLLPLGEVFSEPWATWITNAAECKAAPTDYVMAGVLSVLSSVLGNSRWVSPWNGWSEPPVLWSLIIGTPSSSKSPALDAVLEPLKRIERRLRQDVEAEHAEWQERAELAKLAEGNWQKKATEALKTGKEPPAKPDAANAGPEPHMPCLAVSDATVERLAVIAARQPRGLLMARDEATGWLQSMTRYANGGSDRPFWLEAYGGRTYSQERMGRDPVYIPRLTIGVVGGIQPDRMKTLLVNSDDDGLLARLLPIWPDPTPIRRPVVQLDEAFMERAVQKLLSLQLVTTEDGDCCPWALQFDEEARCLLDEFRKRARQWENDAEGLLQSFIGKLPGIAVRLSLVLAYMDWAVAEEPEPHQIMADQFGRAAGLIDDYLLPMARRAYAASSVSETERAARRLVSLVRERRWATFATRDVLRLSPSGLATADQLKPVLVLLEDADVIRELSSSSGKQGGRRSRQYEVNPALLNG